MNEATEFRVLGPLELHRDGEPVRITSPKQRGLLALLLLRPNMPVEQDVLIEALWGDDMPPTARAAFHNQVHALRRLLGSGAIDRTPAGYALRVPPEKIDVVRFGRLVEQARHASAIERAATLREALALWRGRAFPELASNPSARATVTRLDEERLGAVEDLIDVELELGQHAALIPELQELVVEHPLRERLWAQLMLALYRAGRQADALDAYLRAHNAFAETLGVEPGIVLQRLQRAILVQDRALDEPTQMLGSTLERAAAILPRHPSERAESLFEYGSALIRVGELRQAASTLEAAWRLAVDAHAGGLTERIRVQLSYLAVFADGESMVDQLPVAEHACQVLAELGDDAGLAFASAYRAHLLRDTGRAEEALRLALFAAELAARAGDRAVEATCWRRAAYCACLGPTPVAEALALCEAADARRDERTPLSARDGVAWMLAQAGRIDEARDVYRVQLGRLRQRGVILDLALGLAYAAQAERVVRDLSRAAAHLRAADALDRAVDVRGDRAAMAGELACALALQGEFGEAEALANEARAAVASGDAFGEILWRRALAIVSAHEGSFAEARRLSDEACEQAGRTDWLTFRGETLEDAALVRGLAGDARGRSDALAAALEAYEQKGNVVGAARVRAALMAA